MANAPKSFTQIPSKFLEEKPNDRQKAPLIEVGERGKQMNGGFKLDLFPSSSSLELNLAKVSEPLEDLTIENYQQEFCCKYCRKTFTNKQALGGHQNAHKLERSIEKCTKRAMAEMGCLNTDLPKYPGIPSVHPSALNRHPNTLSCSMINSPYYSPTMQSTMLGRYRAHSSPFSMTPGLYSPQPLPRLSHFDGRCLKSETICNPSATSRRLTLVNQAANGPYLPTEIAKFNRESKSAASIDLSSTTLSMFRFGSPFGSDDNTRSNETENQRCRGSGLDLSLKL